jgi:uncharacterized protein YndB with AHSA1/START domain
MITFTTDVRVARPVEEVFAYVSDPLTYPRWNSAVQSVRRTAGASGDVGATYSLERQLPIGRAENELEVVARERPTAFVIRTTSGPTPFVYRYRFSAEHGETHVQLDGEVELGRAAALLGPLAGLAVRRGVDDNLAALKKLLELRAPPVRGGS